jgi:hypothetical protein
MKCVLRDPSPEAAQALQLKSRVFVVFPATLKRPRRACAIANNCTAAELAINQTMPPTDPLNNSPLKGTFLQDDTFLEFKTLYEKDPTNALAIAKQMSKAIEAKQEQVSDLPPIIAFLVNKQTKKNRDEKNKKKKRNKKAKKAVADLESKKQTQTKSVPHKEKNPAKPKAPQTTPNQGNQPILKIMQKSPNVEKKSVDNQTVQFQQPLDQADQRQKKGKSYSGNKSQKKYRPKKNTATNTNG